MMWLMSGASAVRCYRFWRQVPGHLRCVESNSLGLVWGIGWDGTAWVYSGRCGQQPIPGKPTHKFKITFRNRLTLQNMWTSFTENTKHLMAFNVRQKGKFLPDFLYKLVWIHVNERLIHPPDRLAHQLNPLNSIKQHRYHTGVPRAGHYFFIVKCVQLQNLHRQFKSWLYG